MLTAILFAHLAAANGGPTNAALEAAVVRYDRAQVSSDKAELEALLADDYVLANSGGSTETKAQFIADQVAAGYHLEPFEVRSPISRTWSDGAIRGGVVRMRGTDGGKSFDACIRFADIWRRGARGWQVAFTQVARAVPEQCTGSAQP